MAKEIDYDKEISYCNEQIAKYRRKRQDFERKKKEQENEKIIALIRSHKLSVEELTEFVNAFKSDKKITEKENISNA